MSNFNSETKDKEITLKKFVNRLTAGLSYPASLSLYSLTARAGRQRGFPYINDYTSKDKPNLFFVMTDQQRPHTMQSDRNSIISCFLTIAINCNHYFMRFLNPKLIVVFLFILVVCSPPCYGQVRGKPWNSHVVDNQGFGADGVRIYHNKNQLLFTVPWEQSGFSRVYVYDKNKNKIKVLQVPSVGTEDALTTDLEEDGRLDVITFQEDGANKIHLYKASDRLNRLRGIMNGSRGKYSSDFDSQIISKGLNQMWMYGEVHDFNKDGFKDIVAGSKNKHASVTLFLNPGATQTGWKHIQLSEAGWIMSIKLLDMDGDGDLDVLISDRRGDRKGIRWLENPGKAKLEQHWESHNLGLIGEHPFFLNVYKMKGTWVIYASESDSGFYRFQKSKDGHWQEKKLFNIPDQCGEWVKDIALVDLDGDGKLEVVTAYNKASDTNGIIYSKRTNNGWRHYAISGLPGPKFDVLKFADMDGDGDLDVLSTEENDNSDTVPGLGFIWYENPLR